MPSKTPIVGLNQWLGTDQFLRDNFNADNLKTEQAVIALQAQHSALQTNLDEKYQYLTQTVHQLLLMQEAETYYTDSRLALICDGFGGLDKAQAMDEGVGIVPASRVLAMGTYIPPVDAVDYGVGSRTTVTAGNTYTLPFSIAYCGGLSSLTSRLYSSTVTVPSLSLSLYEIDPYTGQRLFVKSITHHSTRVTDETNSAIYNFDGVYVRSGKYELDIVPDRTIGFYSIISSLKYTSFTCTAGSFASVPFNLPSLSATGLRGILRHSAGSSVSLSVRTGAGTAYALPCTATRDGLTMDGTPCKLSEYALDGLPATALSGTLSVELALSASGGTMAVFDYAVYLV